MVSGLKVKTTFFLAIWDYLFRRAFTIKKRIKKAAAVKIIEAPDVKS